MDDFEEKKPERLIGNLSANRNEENQWWNNSDNVLDIVTNCQR